MQFEFDLRESKRNLQKRDMGFQAAQALWDDPRLLEARLSFPPPEPFPSLC